MLKRCRKYLQWVQNSVFEGEISEANYEKMIYELKTIMEDKVILAYKVNGESLLEDMGKVRCIFLGGGKKMQAKRVRNLSTVNK